MTNGKESKTTSPAAWICLALEADGLLVFHRIGNKEAARLALARVKLVDELSPQPTMSSGEWTVAKACEIFLADLHQSATLEWAKLVEKWLNDLCGYCGALKVEGVQKKHLRTWIQQHKSWNHNTQRNVIASVKAAFNFCCKFDDLESPGRSQTP